jgi:hypothetical protein
LLILCLCVAWSSNDVHSLDPLTFAPHARYWEDICCMTLCAAEVELEGVKYPPLTLAATGWGLYKLNPVDPYSLKAPGFNPS